ncbi:MAG: hypothetical protein KF767_03630 [Bdellovibrionaceae bacterium]|nr:hypothetical protein [Pseudobdellovibrionaceae bacterium]
MELTPYSKDGIRPLSRFHAEELLYEYAQGTLDDNRKLALEEYLKTDTELQRELQRIRRGLGYLDGLSSFRASNESLERVRVSTNFMDKVNEKLRVEDWPAGLKLGLESIAVVSVIFVIAIAVPWNALFEVIQDETSSVTLAEVRREQRKSAPETADETLMELVKDVVFDDEGVPESAFTSPQKTVDDIAGVPQVAGPNTTLPAAANVAPAAAPAAQAPTAPGTAKPTEAPPKRSASSETPAVPAVPAVAPAPVVVPAPVVAKAPVATPTQAAAIAAATAPKPQDPVAFRGFLYRGRLQVTNVEAVTPKLVEFVNTAGGRKAGQVDLGWQKGQGSYFHFTIPEAKYEELEAFFREYGTLVISKERHERVMPEGIIRLIVEVEEKK